MLPSTVNADKPKRIYIPPKARDLAALRLYGDERESAVLSQRVGWYGPHDYAMRGSLWRAEFVIWYDQETNVAYRMHIATDSALVVPNVLAAVRLIEGEFAGLAEFLDGWPSTAAVLGVQLVAEPRATRRCANIWHIIDQRTGAARPRKSR